MNEVILKSHQMTIIAKYYKFITLHISCLESHQMTEKINSFYF